MQKLNPLSFIFNKKIYFIFKANTFYFQVFYYFKTLSLREKMVGIRVSKEFALGCAENLHILIVAKKRQYS